MCTQYVYKISVYSHLNPARLGRNWWTAVTERNGIWATAGSESGSSQRHSEPLDHADFRRCAETSANSVDGACAPDSGSSGNCLECCQRAEAGGKLGEPEVWAEYSCSKVVMFASIVCVQLDWMTSKCMPNLGASVKLETLGDIEQVIFGRKFNIWTGHVKRFREIISSVHLSWQVWEEETKEVKTKHPFELPHEYLPELIEPIMNSIKVSKLIFIIPYIDTHMQITENAEETKANLRPKNIPTNISEASSQVHSSWVRIQQDFHLIY